MRPKPWMLALAVGFAVAAIGFDVWSVAKTRRLRASAAELAQNYERLNREIQIESQKEAAGARARATAGPVAIAAAPISQDRESRPAVDPKELIAFDPKLRAQSVRLYRDSLDVRWGLLSRMLGLSPAQSDRFKDLLAQISANELQTAAAAADRGLDAGDPAMRSRLSDLDRPVWQNMATLLGPQGYATYRQYAKNSDLVSTLVDVAGNLPDASLSTDQAGRLLTVLAAASQKTAGGSAMGDTIDVDQAIAQAGSLLQPDQLPVLAAILQKAEAQRQLRQLSAAP